LRTADEWLELYAGVLGANPRRPSAWLGTPLLAASLVGLLWSLPVPGAFRTSFLFLNWGIVFLMATVVYYFILSISLALGALPFVLGIAVLIAWADRLVFPLWALCGATFLVVAAWQLTEARLAQERIRWIQYLQYVMLGPMWLLAALYRRLHVPY
jgi:hypothetical protein